MIYVDTSVLLARLLAEDHAPPDSFWQQTLVSSRLIEYETWNRIHARKLLATHSDSARMLLGRIAMVELTQPVLARALEPFPVVTRTLDALHLASMCFVRNSDPSLAVATYDERLARAARSLKFKILRP